MHWISSAQNKHGWRALVVTANVLQAPQKVADFLSIQQVSAYNEGF
jgi:hypothetical protein